MLRFIILAVTLGLCVPAANACGRRPDRQSLAQISKYSDVVVRGELTYFFRENSNLLGENDAWLIGNIAAKKIKKDDAAQSFPVRHIAMQFYCSGAGWQPDAEQTPRAYRGDFYLRRTTDNNYVILGYRP